MGDSAVHINVPHADRHLLCATWQPPFRVPLINRWVLRNYWVLLPRDEEGGRRGGGAEHSCTVRTCPTSHQQGHGVLPANSDVILHQNEADSWGPRAVWEGHSLLFLFDNSKLTEHVPTVGAFGGKHSHGRSWEEPSCKHGRVVAGGGRQHMSGFPGAEAYVTCGFGGITQL